MKGITLQLGGNMDISIKCDSLKAIYSVKNGMLRCVAPYEFTISLMPMIKVCIIEIFVNERYYPPILDGA